MVITEGFGINAVPRRFGCPAGALTLSFKLVVLKPCSPLSEGYVVDELYLMLTVGSLPSCSFVEPVRAVVTFCCDKTWVAYSARRSESRIGSTWFAKVMFESGCKA